MLQLWRKQTLHRNLRSLSTLKGPANRQRISMHPHSSAKLQEEDNLELTFMPWQFLLYGSLGQSHNDPAKKTITTSEKNRSYPHQQIITHNLLPPTQPLSNLNLSIIPLQIKHHLLFSTNLTSPLISINLSPLSFKIQYLSINHQNLHTLCDLTSPHPCNHSSTS